MQWLCVYSWDNSVLCVVVSAPHNMIKYSVFFPIHSFASSSNRCFFFSQVVFLWFLIWICVALIQPRDANQITRAAITTTTTTTVTVTKKTNGKMWQANLNYWPSLLKINFFFLHLLLQPHICIFCIISDVYVHF